MKYRTILLFGEPGSGKGTQGKILGSIPNFFHCACGAVFRNLRVDNPLGRTFLEYSSKGQLVPDQFTIELWRKNIEASTMEGSFQPERDTLVLDGIPRTAHQAEMLQGTLDVKAVIHLTCPDMNKLVDRLQRRALRENRLDDANLDIIRDRLATYENETKPLLDFYGAKLVHNIDSTQAPICVVRDIIDTLARI